jgi:hypothetical protein
MQDASVEMIPSASTGSRRDRRPMLPEVMAMIAKATT